MEREAPVTLVRSPSDDRTIAPPDHPHRAVVGRRFAGCATIKLHSSSAGFYPIRRPACWAGIAVRGPATAITGNFVHGPLQSRCCEHAQYRQLLDAGRLSRDSQNDRLRNGVERGAGRLGAASSLCAACALVHFCTVGSARRSFPPRAGRSCGSAIGVFHAPRRATHTQPDRLAFPELFHADGSWCRNIRQ